MKCSKRFLLPGSSLTFLLAMMGVSATTALANSVPTFDFSERGDSVRVANGLATTDPNNRGCLTDSLPVELVACFFFTAPQLVGLNALAIVYFHEPGQPANIASDYVQLKAVALNPLFGEFAPSFVSDYPTADPSSNLVIPPGAVVLDETGFPIDLTTLLTDQLPAGTVIPSGFRVTAQSEVSETPEPGTVSLIICGLTGLAGVVRKKACAVGF